MFRPRRFRAPVRRKKQQVFRLYVKRPAKCPIQAAGITEVDYKDVDLLRQYLTEEGRIMPARLSGLSARMQRQLTAAVKRARRLALLPYTDFQRQEKQ